MSNTPEKLFLKKTSDSPEVIIDKEIGIMQFSGRSLPENPKRFYSSIIEWIEKYLNSDLAEMLVVFQFEYINTASSKMILDMLELIKTKFENQKELLNIEWHYQEDDIDMLEAGEDFEEWTKLKFNFSSYE